MMDYHKEDAILHRQFELGADSSANLYVWKPFEERDGTWACPYLIEGLGKDRLRNGYGGDSVQAFWLSLQIAATYLYASEAYHAGQLTWFASRDLGLPMIPGVAPSSGKLGQAQLLTTAGQSAIISIPGCPLPYAAFPGERLTRFTEQLRTISIAHPEAGLAAIVKGLEAELSWYEANCNPTPPTVP